MAEASAPARRNDILRASQKHPQPGRKFQYGTAGLDGQTVGIMITASHNPPEDNGIKLVDPLSSWEAHATELANAVDDEACVAVYEKLCRDLRIKENNPSKVIFARDTRPSGPDLVQAVVDGLQAAGAVHEDFGLKTTPQLHYLVRCVNTRDTALDYGEPTAAGYNKKLGDALKTALKYAKSKGAVVVDCANGIGGPALRELVKTLPSASDGGLDIKIINDDTSKPEVLNVQCGADHVKTQQKPPLGYKHNDSYRFASFDGDADRLMYYFTDPDGRFHLLDGDRIATLAAAFLTDLAQQAGLSDKLRMGVVQTAYANGASTEYVTGILKLPVVCTPTGVKYLHHAAQRFDVGVYFEANGHGTVIFSQPALKAIRTYEPKSPAQLEALEVLQAMSDLINQTVGDAISDMLLVEVILAHKKWGPLEWLQTYDDLPNRLVRVQVPDRNLFRTVDAERKLDSPLGAQAKIDQLVARYAKGRSFARASGTEDAVRVYAEAQARGEADDLAQRVADIIRAAGGSGGSMKY